MFAFLKPTFLYTKLYTDKVEITRLDKGLTISRSALEKFSNVRLVIADFYKAEEFVSSIIKELLASNTIFQPSHKILIQQMDKLEGGLSDVERRALRDLGEHVGGRYVKLVESEKPLTTSQALLELLKK